MNTRRKVPRKRPRRNVTRNVATRNIKRKRGNRTRKGGSATMAAAAKASSGTSGTMINRMSAMMNSDHLSRDMNVITASIDGMINYAEDFIQLFKMYKLLAGCDQYRDTGSTEITGESITGMSTCIEKIGKWNTSQYISNVRTLASFYYGVSEKKNDKDFYQDVKDKLLKDLDGSIYIDSKHVYTMGPEILKELTDASIEDGLDPDIKHLLLKILIRRLMDGFIYGIPCKPRDKTGGYLTGNDMKNKWVYTPIPVYKGMGSTGGTPLREAFKDIAPEYIPEKGSLYGTVTIKDDALDAADKKITTLPTLNTYIVFLSALVDTNFNSITGDVFTRKRYLVKVLALIHNLIDVKYMIGVNSIKKLLFQKIRLIGSDKKQFPEGSVVYINDFNKKFREFFTEEDKSDPTMNSKAALNDLEYSTEALSSQAKITPGKDTRLEVSSVRKANKNFETTQREKADANSLAKASEAAKPSLMEEEQLQKEFKAEMEMKRIRSEIPKTTQNKENEQSAARKALAKNEYDKYLRTIRKTNSATPEANIMEVFKKKNPRLAANVPDLASASTF